MPPQVCDGSGKIALCATREPHRHCICGLPVLPDVALCRFCRAESERGVDLFPPREDEEKSR